MVSAGESSEGRPALSVIIPTHDTRELTLACLTSLARQDLPDLEVIVVDDASGDGTAEALAARFPAARVLRLAAAQGFTRAANCGLAAARGEILLLLNSDTEVDPGGLQALLAAFASCPRLGAAGGALRYPDGSPQWSGGRAPSLLWLFGLASGLPAWLGRRPLYRRLRPPSGSVSGSGSISGRVDWVTGAALGLRRAALQEVGNLDEEFRFYAQDLDLCLRLAARGWEVSLAPEFRVLHHHGATIGKTSGARGLRGQSLELLWSDLLLWARKARGAGWGRRARRAIRIGASLRLAARGLLQWVIPTGERAAFRAGTAALRQALRAIRRPPLAPPPPLV